MRTAKLKRTSGETDISIKINLDGSGKSKIITPISFLNHMLEAFSKHGIFDLNIDAKGDVNVDQHHTVEDIGIMLGKSIKTALSDKKGINRTGFFAFPMDESLGIVAVDFGGRPYLVFKTEFKNTLIGNLESASIREFFSGFSMGGSCNISIYVPFGENDHHKAEAIFKAFGKAVMMACSKNKALKSAVPTTKGMFDEL